MDETLERLGETIAGALAGSVLGHWVADGELTVVVTPLSRNDPQIAAAVVNTFSRCAPRVAPLLPPSFATNGAAGSLKPSLAPSKLAMLIPAASG